MEFYITYRQEVKRIVQAVVIDNRGALGLANENGNVIQPYVDAKVIDIGDKPFYVIEGDNGSLAAYFYLNITNGVATLAEKNYRPNYSAFYTQFDTMISEFIVDGNWYYDVLIA